MLCISYKICSNWGWHVLLLVRSKGWLRPCLRYYCFLRALFQQLLQGLLKETLLLCVLSLLVLQGGNSLTEERSINT